jgi:hypothetical protein
MVRMNNDYSILDMERLGNDGGFYDSKGKKNDISYDEAYDHLKSFMKKNNKPSSEVLHNKGSYWGFNWI